VQGGPTAGLKIRLIPHPADLSAVSAEHNHRLSSVRPTRHNPAMIPAVASAAMPLLKSLRPERAHRLALRALRLGLIGRQLSPDDPALATEVLGLRFLNPIGLAAGFDKDAEAIAPLSRLGFGFVETGTVTPRPQAGNPRPRLFRLVEDRAVVNRMGFNNAGIAAYVARLQAQPRTSVPIGANIGINKSGAEPERDYAMLLAAVAPFVDYIVINVSSPNTPGLRDLQDEARLGALLRAADFHVPRRPPLLVKVAPDLSQDGLAGVIDVCVRNNVQGLVVSNTTVTRPPGLRSRHALESGGLSGRPLFASSTAMLARAHLLTGGRLSLIGVGGVSTGEEALIKIKAGAALVQIYTALVFDGPALVPRLKRELAAALRRDGFAHVKDAVGVEAARLAQNG
jgi:dihydroorotate dehydrogenase